MTDRAVETSPQFYARAGGWLYLIVIAAGMFAVVPANLIVSGDAAATAKNIMASESLWRLGPATNILAGVCYVAITLILYVLLRPVNRNLSLLAAFFSLVGIAVGGVNTIGSFAPLLLLGGADYLKAFDPHQLQALSLLFVKLGAYGTAITLVFFGLYCLMLGYLIFRSGYLPKFLGILLTIGSLCYLTNSFADFLAPAFAARLFPVILMPAVIAELLLCLWLIVMGVNVPKFEAQARLAS